MFIVLFAVLFIINLAFGIGFLITRERISIEFLINCAISFIGLIVSVL
jgi:hypothetical protein